MEQLSNTSGYLAGIFFIIANAYYPAKMIAKHIVGWNKDLALFFTKYLKIHVTFNFIALFFLLIHGHYAEEKTGLLRLSFIVTILLIIEGVVMYYKLLPDDSRYIRMLHTQQALFWIWIILIIIGHIKVI